MDQKLLNFPIHHAGIKPVFHPRLKTMVNGQIAVRYMRFLRPVRLRRLELPASVYGRWAPSVPTHPAHLIIEILEPRTNQWKLVRQINLPYDRRIAGAGLSQDASLEDMEAYFRQVLARKRPHVIDLGGLTTDHLRVVCDREHPVWPSHGECNGGEFNVPFGILDSLQAFGEPKAGRFPDPPYYPGLKVGSIHPIAPTGMRVRRDSLLLKFEGPQLSVGFSLRRPMLLHLGWDANDSGLAGKNRLLATRWRDAALIGGLNGPSFRTLQQDCLPHHWTGEISVKGNIVRYHHLSCGIAGLEIEAAFTVEPERLILELTQRSTRDVAVIQGEAWRLAWDIQAAMTGAAALPTLRLGRNGEVHLPLLWAGDDVGCLSCTLLEGPAESTWQQIESYKSFSCLTGGFVLGKRPTPDYIQVVPAGTLRATWAFGLANLQPNRMRRGSGPMDEAITRNWASLYSCFRPELGGFSNQAISVNCHVNQHAPAEIVAFTRPPETGPKPLELFRFTIERALLDGGGYGYCRNLYLDSDPVLISAAGRIHQTEPNPTWLRRIEPGLLETVQRILATLGKEGLAICRDLSGNSGSFRWSSNAMDVVGFGHMDAYVNAWTYRALRNAAALLHILTHQALAEQCRAAAARLKLAFGKYLLNPATGWVAGWRSRDGQLHDYAFLWINGPACAFGLLDRPAARKALLGLERLRMKVGAGSGAGGLPFNLLPIARDDHILPLNSRLAGPTFEHYTNGAMSACFAIYYLRALSIHGLKNQARKLAGELAESYAAGLWTSGVGTTKCGVEFRSWDGLPCGYEGTFVDSFGALYAIAIERGLFKPPEPEWWPPGGN